MQATNRVIKNTGILYVKMGITMFISLYATRVVLNALGASDFGVFAVVGGAIAMLTFLNSAMAAATQRFMSFAQGENNIIKQKQIFNVSVLLHFAIGLCVVIGLLAVQPFTFNKILNIDADRIFAATRVYQFMVVSTFFTIVTVPYDAVLNAHENMLYYAIVGIIEALLKLGTALFVAYTMADKLIVYGGLMASITIFILIIMRIYCHKNYEECTYAPKRYYNKAILKDMAGFAGWNFLGSASSMISGYGSGLILNHFFGTILNAANGVAGQINGQLLVFSNTMQKALNPVIAKSEGAGQREYMIKATLSGSKMSFLMFAFFGIPFIIEAPYILQLWLKNVPDWAVLFCRLAIVFTLTEQLTRTLATAIASVGFIKRLNTLNSIIILTNLLILYLLFKFGAPPYLMPVSAIVVAFLVNLVKIYDANAYCGITYKRFYQTILKPCLLVFIFTYIVSYLGGYFIHQPLIKLLSTLLISTIAFIAFAYMFALNSSELNIIKKGLTTLIKYVKK
ncbi:MAG: hypothetical protein PF517_13915 [Salinivirgaceae bacterium]|jgi:O-antigen/teichoic acid export membrane protein|nr:hypothetical protein [Salinivirgaceae bacterium]